MSQTEVQLPKEEVKATPEQQEKQRLLLLILSKKDHMTAEYKALVRHTGGLTCASMVIAYDKALNDVIKLLLKEKKDEETVKQA